MARERSAGKIVFVSSLLGYMSFIGYSSYSPAKHALRGMITPSGHIIHSSILVPGLAETLRSELLLYSVSVHVYFPGTIYSPGYIEENKTKPKVTLKIEETDGGLEPEQAAEGLLRGGSKLPYTCAVEIHTLLAGVQRGNFHITPDLLGDIFRSSTRGSTPQNNVFTDALFSLIGWVRYVAVPSLGMTSDRYI